MYAVVEIAGQQFKVEKDQKLFVHRLDKKEGSIVSFDRVYLVDDGKNISFGTPSISGTYVNAKVLKHLKGEKVIVFKKKRRKGYRVKNGHKQQLSEILIESISKSNNLNKKVKDIKAVPTKNSSKNESVKEDNEKSNLTSKTLSELKEIAKNKKITGYSSMKKADLVKTINSLN